MSEHDTPEDQKTFCESVQVAARATNKRIDEIVNQMVREIGERVDELRREREKRK